MADILGWWRTLPWHRLRPWAWAVGVVFAAVGLWRVETTANDAHANADRLADIVDQLEAERVNRCVAGRADIRAAIVRVVDDFTDLPPDELGRLADVVRDELPSASCLAAP